MDVNIDQLSSERAAEGGREGARLDADDDVPAAGTVVVDLEVCDVERSCVEIARGRIGVIAWTVVIAGRVADVEDLSSGNEVPHYRAAGVSCASIGRSRRDLDHGRARPNRDRSADRA